jgi:hypothetical protein
MQKPLLSPKKHLRDVAASIQEDEQVPAQRLEPKLRFDQRSEPIEALARVDWLLA